MLYALCFFILILSAISIGDFRHRIISNELLCALFLLVICSTGLTGHKIYFSSAILSLVIGGVIWYLRFAGAGDIKLIAILSLVIVPELFLDILPVFAVSTLGLLLAMYSSDRFFNTKTLTKGIPMGIPISIAGMVGVFASLY